MAVGIVMSLTLALAAHVIPRSPAHPTMLLGGNKLPAQIAAGLDDQVPPSAVLPLWKELRKCYPNEEQALRAAEKQPLVLLPFINTPDNIRFCFQVLGELGFSDEERLDIITRNPGVLANKPGELSLTSPGEIRFSLAVIDAVEAVPAPLRKVIPSVTGVSIIYFIAKRLEECAGGVCG